MNSRNLTQLRSHLVSASNDFRNATSEDELMGRLLKYVLGIDGTPLLAKELFYLKQRDYPGTRPRPVDVLALTVGTSFEPILLSAALSQPRTVLLICAYGYKGVIRNNDDAVLPGQQYGGEIKNHIEQTLPKIVLAVEEAADLEDLDRRWGAAGLLPTWRPRAHVVVCGDTPLDVFSALRRNILFYLPQIRESDGGGNTVGGASAAAGQGAEKKRRSSRTRPTIAVEITGAKKSMAAGAFVFAAAMNMDIRYLDFDSYDASRGAPRSFSCRVRELKDPARLMGLHRWDRAGKHFTAWDFSGAAGELREWRNAIVGADEHLPELDEEDRKSGASVFEEQDLKSADRLLRATEAYAYWYNGELHAADAILGASDLLGRIVNPRVLNPSFLETWIRLPGAPDDLPHQNEISAAIRRFIDEEVMTKQDAILASSFNVCIYAADELAKLEKTARAPRDCRSLFLRAHGLSEFLLTARVALGRECGHLTVSENESRRPIAEDEYAAVLKIIGCVKELVTKGKSAIKIDKAKKKIMLERPSEWTAPGFLARFDSFKDLRDKAIHLFVSVPPHFAIGAVRDARENFEDFKRSWAHCDAIGEPEFSCDDENFDPGWRELNEACGVVFMPIYQQREE